jgi:hypothetical protein
VLFGAWRWWANLNSIDRNTGLLCLAVAKISAFLIIISLATALGGCSVAPSETTVAKAITDYFEAGHYKVVNLRIGRIKGMPLSEKTYMGTPGYVVDVVSITLEPQEDRGADIRKGRRLTFTNATVRVRQDAVNKDVWHVSIVSGIGVP